ncbi:hypothetical protein ACIG53_12670 [Streptomyces bauhiniae]|uniref:hypothetical protein n=1 Tax=Streptomyces bauhiniae TaxID=2340725 RepID=UPI0037D7EDD8
MQRADSDRHQRPTGHVRLLPWETEDNKPCYLSTDGGGLLSRLADDMEAAQLDMGADLLAKASKVLGDPLSPNPAVRYMGVRLAECLRDALRVAESRGMRLPDPDGEDA